MDMTAIYSGIVSTANEHTVLFNMVVVVEAVASKMGRWHGCTTCTSCGSPFSTAY